MQPSQRPALGGRSQDWEPDTLAEDEEGLVIFDGGSFSRGPHYLLPPEPEEEDSEAEEAGKGEAQEPEAPVLLDADASPPLSIRHMPAHACDMQMGRAIVSAACANTPHRLGGRQTCCRADGMHAERLLAAEPLLAAEFPRSRRLTSAHRSAGARGRPPGGGRAHIGDRHGGGRAAPRQRRGAVPRLGRRAAPAPAADALRRRCGSRIQFRSRRLLPLLPAAAFACTSCRVVPS